MTNAFDRNFKSSLGAELQAEAARRSRMAKFVNDKRTQGIEVAPISLEGSGRKDPKSLVVKQGRK